MNIEKGLLEESIVENNIYNAIIIELAKTVENGITKNELFDAVKGDISENGKETKISQLSKALKELKDKGFIVENQGIIKISSKGKNGLFNLLSVDQIDSYLGR
ncbi:MAG: hypothetical protein KAS78_00320 [Candidatus Pacebacteria bacterium]|nr:hypothetical protein [Candidatus Paceibacterota bacterium]